MALQKITDGITGEQAANIIYDNDVDNANKIPPTQPSKNLFNLATIQIDKLQPSSVAPVQSAAGWHCSDFIPITTQAYTISATTKGREGVGLYDAAKVCVRYLNLNTGTFTALLGEAYAIINLDSPASPGYSNVQFEVGSVATSYQAYGAVVDKDNVQDLEIIEDTANNALTKADEALAETVKLAAFDISELTGTNLLDPGAITAGFLLSEINGSAVTPTANYNTSDFMPVTAGSTYKFINAVGPEAARKYCWYNASQVFISGIDNPAYNATAVAPAGAAFLRISFPSINFNPTYSPANFGVFLGAAAAFEPYQNGYKVLLAGDNTPTAQKEDKAVATIYDAKSLAVVQADDPKNTVDFIYASGNLTMLYPEGSLSGVVLANNSFSGNNQFNFTGYNLKGVNTSNADDTAPQHIYNSTYGANHGNGYYTAATITGHGLTNTDIGTEWLQGGTKFYIMRIINANTVGILGEMTGTTASPVFAVLTTGTITRGATSLTVSAVSVTQLYPSIGGLTRKVLRDGITEITDENGTAKFIDVVETYTILDPTSVLNAIKARVGSSAAPDFTQGTAAVKVENTYRFLPNMTVVVLQNVRYLAAIAFSDIMTTQAIILGANDNTTQYYIPNSNPIGMLDFRTPINVAWSGSVAPTFVTISASPDPANPPNRIVMYRGNLGFMIAYMTNRGVGKNLPGYTARTFEIRNNTGKIYPHAVEDTVVGNMTTVDEFYSIAMVRAYCDLSAVRIGNRLSLFNYNFEGAEYVYLDYSGNMTDHVNLDKPSLNGKTITPVAGQMVNTTLQTDTYNDGFYIKAAYVAGQTCFAVLLIK